MPKPAIPASPKLNSSIKLKTSYCGAIAIPCFNESLNLPQVIESLGKNPPELIDKTLIIINVNNRFKVSNADNLITLEYLKNLKTNLQLAWLDATTDFAYPDKFGVGLARHQACSMALSFLADNAPLISLDSDSPVNLNYLEAIYSHYANKGSEAGHVNFNHQITGSPQEQRAIKLYDTHLKLHREGLASANSPHAWYAIGSTIVCSAGAYKKCGGYNPRRMAGEDFYLLQQLSKCGYKIELIKDACVYPSNRSSDRVPFGTGKAVLEIIENGNLHTYHPACYEVLGKVLTSVKENLNVDGAALINKLPDESIDFFKNKDFQNVWDKLQKNSRDTNMLLERFHEWLDAFNTLKLIHHLTEKHFPKVLIN